MDIGDEERRLRKDIDMCLIAFLYSHRVID